MLKYILFSHVSEEGWVRRGGKGEGCCGEILKKIVRQNIIPLSLETTNQNTLKSPKLLYQRMRKCYCKTLGTSVINSPLSSPSLALMTWLIVPENTNPSLVPFSIFLQLHESNQPVHLQYPLISYQSIISNRMPIRLCKAQDLAEPI